MQKSVNILTFAKIDMTDTQRPAAPTPANALPKIKTFADGETAQIKLPSSNVTMHMR